MGKWDGLIARKAGVGVMSDPRVLNVADFRSEHPKGDRLGTPGFMASTHEDDKNHDLVVKAGLKLSDIDGVATEGAAITRLRKKVFDISVAGVAVPRENGKPINIMTDNVEPEMARLLVNFLKLKIAEAHMAGIAVVDVKTDAILVENDTDMEMVDYSGAILLPEWSGLISIWKWRNDFEEVLNQKKEVEMIKAEKAAKLASTELQGYEIRTLGEKMIKFAEVVDMDSGDGNSVLCDEVKGSTLFKKMLGADLMKRFRHETEVDWEAETWFLGWLTDKQAVDRNKKRVLEADKKGWKIVKDRALELGLIEVNLSEEKVFEVDKDIVDILIMHYGFGVEDLLGGEEIAIKRMNAGRTSQAGIIKEGYHSIIGAVNKYRETESVTDGMDIIKGLDGMATHFLDNFYAEVRGDWFKFARLYENKSLDGVRNEEFNGFLKDSIEQMDKALKVGDYDSLADIDLNLTTKMM
ncbi:hypothetical protein KBC75_01330 [Candidatus Shapirobacteria bacterium]|nr:hypothetical protein [Candidatus Shapirobacteria bacterium]